MQLKEIKSFIEGRKKELRALSDDIWKHPRSPIRKNTRSRAWPNL